MITPPDDGLMGTGRNARKGIAGTRHEGVLQGSP